MEFCVGSTLDLLEVLSKGLTEEEISAITAQTLEALVYLHENKKIHRLFIYLLILFFYLEISLFHHEQIKN